MPFMRPFQVLRTFPATPLDVMGQSYPVSHLMTLWQPSTDTVCKSLFPATRQSQPATDLFIEQERKTFSGLEAPRWAATVTDPNVSLVLYDQQECVFSFEFSPFGFLHLVNTGKVNVKMSALFPKKWLTVPECSGLFITNVTDSF